MTKTITIAQAAQHVWDFVGIGDGVEIDFNDRAQWVAIVSSAARRERLKRANGNKDWSGDEARSASTAATRIVQTWQAGGWDTYSGPRDALINVLALAAYDGGNEYFDMIRGIFGEDALRVGHPSLEPVS